MNEEHNRDDRWLAYLLGELSREESAEVELEMESFPEEATATRAAFDETRAWAQRPIPHEPIRLGDLPVSDSANATAKRNWVEALRSRQGMLIAASILFLALTQAQFSYSFTDSRFTWGADSGSDLPPLTDSATPVDQFATSATKIEALERKSAETVRVIEALVLNSNYLGEALEQKTRELAVSQRLESQARHRDMQRMISWTEYPGYADAARHPRAAQQGGLEATPAGNPQ